MIEQQSQDSAAAYAEVLLVHYSFELAGYKAEELIGQWLKNYSASWVRLAVIEALYQGRYKSISVEQILAVWSRRGRALYHFNHEFERLICRKFPQNLLEVWMDDATLPKAETEAKTEVRSISPVPASVRPPSESEIKTHDIPEVKPQEKVTPQEWPTPTYALEGREGAKLRTQNYPQVGAVSAETAQNHFKLKEHLPEQPTDIGKATGALVRQSPAQIVSYQADWSRWDASKRPIDQFTPPPDASDFYQKLKSVAQHQKEKGTGKS
jgi:hypothetical protein